MERIHADTQYTYAPYNAYWGDYYTIQGDGAAAGQTAQDDVFLYYPRDTAQTQLEARADADPSVLDRMEASYAAYAASRYTAVPDGYDELQTLCDEAKKDQKLTEAADIGDYIRAYLNTNYQYNASAPQPPEGADPHPLLFNGIQTGVQCAVCFGGGGYVPHVRAACALCGGLCRAAKPVYPTGGRQLARHFAGR